jgi:DNA-binding SARP family transcriptional activator
MRVQVLGGVALQGHDGPLQELPGRSVRRLLCVLAMSAGRSVPDERVVDAVWFDARRPRDPSATLRTYVARLRRSSGAIGIGRSATGYRLDVGSRDLDVALFGRAVATGLDLVGRRCPSRAEAALRSALALWRGPPWRPLEGWLPADADAVRCVELHAQAEEQAAACVLAAGRTGHAVSELLRLTRLDPLREHRLELLMTALTRAGRHADALAAYQRARRHLAEELGLEPSPRLRDLERAVLAHEPLEPSTGAVSPAPPTVARVSRCRGGCRNPVPRR